MAATRPVFSHKRHAPLDLPCANCHTGAVRSERAGFPAIAQCRACHPKLAPAAAKFPTRRVYRLPDFAIFGHARHAAGKVECATCHGVVTARDVLRLEAPTTMKACVDCHRSRGATEVCNACHELSR